MEVSSVFSLQPSVFRKNTPEDGKVLPPYLASTLWMQRKVDSKALKTRDYTRCLIESNSPEGMVLTVPVVGSSSAAKRLKPEQLEVSGHGDWTRIHLGAIEAAYGREPYFQHLFPEIAAIITGYTQQLGCLNVLLMETMMTFLDYSEQIGHVLELREAHPERCSAIATRLQSKISPRHSFLEPLFRLGPDALFLLMDDGHTDRLYPNVGTHGSCVRCRPSTA